MVTRMAKKAQRMRLVETLHPQHLFDAYIRDISEEPAGAGATIVFELETLRLLTPAEVRLVEGRPYEVALGERVPMRLTFPQAGWLWHSGVFERFRTLPAEHGARRLFGVSRFRHPVHGDFYWFSHAAEDPGDLAIRGGLCALSEGEGPRRVVEVVRNWSCPPPSRPGLPPRRPVLHRRFGGDPITIRLGGRTLRHRLFIGGLHHQGPERPAVDHVLNLCGVENPWCARSGQHQDDRMTMKGEGPHGMDATDVLCEAEAVATRLRAGQRVLVHCYAGMNRSTTVCCAVLMLLEGISAQDALARVREHHPIAWPDPYHWFVLQWLARNIPRTADGLVPARAQGAPLLQEVLQVG
jgi:hypothetical protein